jgi:hypothetical protein
VASLLLPSASTASGAGPTGASSTKTKPDRWSHTCPAYCLNLYRLLMAPTTARKVRARDMNQNTEDRERAQLCARRGSGWLRTLAIRILTGGGQWPFSLAWSLLLASIAAEFGPKFQAGSGPALALLCLSLAVATAGRWAHGQTGDGEPPSDTPSPAALPRQRPGPHRAGAAAGNPVPDQPVSAALPTQVPPWGEPPTDFLTTTFPRPTATDHSELTWFRVKVSPRSGRVEVIPIVRLASQEPREVTATARNEETAA